MGTDGSLSLSPEHLEWERGLLRERMPSSQHLGSAQDKLHFLHHQDPAVMKPVAFRPSVSQLQSCSISAAVCCLLTVCHPVLDSGDMVAREKAKAGIMVAGAIGIVF